MEKTKKKWMKSNMHKALSIEEQDKENSHIKAMENMHNAAQDNAHKVHKASASHKTIRHSFYGKA